MRRVLVGFLEEAGVWQELAALVREGEWWKAWQAVVEGDPYATRLWNAYVRRCFPLAPDGFHQIGRFGNAKKRQPPGESPRNWPLRGPPGD